MPFINNSSHCYSCGLQSNQLQKEQYPICNQKNDSITIEKHWMCTKCKNAFSSIKLYVHKFNLKWFNPQFSIEQIIDTKLLKFSHIQSSFIKENKRKSELFSSTYSENNGQNQTNNERASDATKLLELNLPNDIYSAIILDHIQKSDLHHLYWLPKTVLYLIHLTQRDKIRTQQRRQRVKKTLQALSFLYCVGQNDIKHLAVIVHTLYCFMDEQSLIKICDRLLKGVLINNMSLELFFIEQIYESQRSFLEQKKQHLVKKPVQFRADNLLFVIHSIFVLLDFFKDGKLHHHVSQIVHLSHQELNKVRQVGYDPHKTIQKSFENYLKSSISQHSSKVSKVSQSAYEELVHIKRQRNHLDLIIKSIKRQHEQNQQIVKEMQSKYKKQKDQYINKIVKLNNHIEKLQSEIKTIKENQMEGKLNNGLNKKIKNLVLENQDDDCAKSNPQLKIQTNINKDNKISKPELITQRTTEVPISDTVNNQEPQSATKKHKSEIQTPKQLDNQNHKEQESLIYLKSILQITDIITFNQKALKKSKKQSASFPLPELPSTLKQLSQIIISEINQLEKKVSSLMSENKKLKEESTRLLAILKRKQQSWLPLLHEKDDIISLYEKALICLEKGFVLSQEPLSSRIQAIVEKVSTIQFIKLEAEDDISIRDSNSVLNSSIVDDIGDDFGPPQNLSEKFSGSQKNTPAKKQATKKVRNSTTQKPSDSNKIKKKTKKQSQCQIF